MRSTTWWSVSFKLRADRPNPAYTVRVSRLFWMGVGAAGGIVVYRKGTNAVNGVRERTFRENLSRVAQGASSVAASARYLANVVSDEPTATWWTSARWPGPIGPRRLLLRTSGQRPWGPCTTGEPRNRPRVARPDGN